MSDSINDEQSDAGALTRAEWNQLCNVMNGYIYSETLATACELDLFSVLGPHPGLTLEGIADKLSLSLYGTRVLLLACCAADLVVRRENGDYANSALAAKVLVRDSPYSMIDFVRFNHDVQQRCSVHLRTALRQRRNAGLDEFPGDGETLYARLTGYPDIERLFQRAMGAYTRLSPRMMHLPQFDRVRRLLDVGGGDGSNAIRLCARYSSLTVRLIDIPSVVEIARKKVAENGLADRIACVSLDMFNDPWPQGHDAVLLSHVVEIFAPERIQLLYRKAYESLPSGGQLFVWTMMADDAETGGLQAAKSSIYFLSTASGEGMAYPGSDHERWLSGMGFFGITRYDARDIDHGAIVAAKPATEAQ